MKKLIVVRHGQYSINDHLSDHGRSQMAILADNIKSLVNNESVLILSSTADRARESAEILGERLVANIEEFKILCAEDSYRENLQRVLELVLSRQDKANVLILVTHYGYVGDFPKYYGDEELKVQLEYRRPGKAEGLVIDRENKTVTRIE
ncbi:histidine phosphatase family protein [Patescibacteria group bacterium]